MNTKDFVKKMESLENKYKRDRHSLFEEYTKANNKVKIGDEIEDSFGNKFVVQDMRVEVGKRNGHPWPFYRYFNFDEENKDDRGCIISMYQSFVYKINGEICKDF